MRFVQREAENSWPVVLKYASVGNDISIERDVYLLYIQLLAIEGSVLLVGVHHKCSGAWRASKDEKGRDTSASFSSKQKLQLSVMAE